MRKRTIGILLILCVIALVGGMVLIELAFVGSSSVYNPDTGSNELTSIGNLPLLITGLILCGAGVISTFVAWIAALVNVARRQDWTWFVLLLLFSWVCLLVYLFAGPEAPGANKVSVYPQPHLD